jgi:Rho guanine nucleotide exchange factor 7
VDLVDVKRDTSAVLHTLQELYYLAADMGFGVEFSRHKRQSQGSGAVLGSTDASGNSSSRESTPGEEEGNGTGLGCFYRAIYSFPGTNEDELQFEKGDLITVTRMVDGGWWEGMCNGHTGWFPGNYVENAAGMCAIQSEVRV